MGSYNKTKYFLGANTPSGFVSFYENLIDLKKSKHLYIIKGGPGTGKSTLMRNLAFYSEGKGYEVEYVFCSGDPDSLDAIVIPELKVAVVDGTSPHMIDPKYPGAVDSIVDLSVCWDREKLSSRRSEIEELTGAYKGFYDVAYRYLTAAAKVENDMYAAVVSGVDFDKINDYCHKLLKKNAIKNKNRQGKVIKRVATTPTYKGMYSFKDALIGQYSNKIIIEDFCSVAGIVMSTLMDIALSIGVDIETYYNGMNYKNGPELLVFKDYDLCVAVSSEYAPLNIEGLRMVRCRRFIDSDIIKSQKQRIKADKKIVFSLMAQAQGALISAKILHDELEEIYKSAMDFNKSEEIRDRIKNELFG